MYYVAGQYLSIVTDVRIRTKVFDKWIIFLIEESNKQFDCNKQLLIKSFYTSN